MLNRLLFYPKNYIYAKKNRTYFQCQQNYHNLEGSHCLKNLVVLFSILLSLNIHINGTVNVSNERLSKTPPHFQTYSTSFQIQIIHRPQSLM